MSEDTARLVRLLTRVTMGSASEVRSLVKGNPVLLHPVADTVLGDLISETDTMDPRLLIMIGGSKETHKRGLQRCRDLLDRARRNGIDRALKDLGW